MLAVESMGANSPFSFYSSIARWRWAFVISRDYGGTTHGLVNTPITHSRFTTKILLRSEIWENEL